MHIKEIISIERNELKPLFKDEYTEFYETNRSDSAESSRDFLIQKIIYQANIFLQTNSRVRILDLGAGKQVLEAELNENRAFAAIKSKVDIISIDLASVTKDQLLAPEYLHIQASGDAIPFADDVFHLVVSSSALDFMPRQAFQEINRVLAADGMLIATFHHESLIEAAQLKLPPVAGKLHSVSQKIKFGHNSRKREVRERQRRELEMELRDIRFVLNVLPTLIFHTVDEIIVELNKYSFQVLTVFESDVKFGSNGWFFAEAIKENSEV